MAWVHDACSLLKVIAHSSEVANLLDVAGVETGEGIVKLAGSEDATVFIEAAGNGRMWAREPLVRTVY
jgi:catalase